jgi:hypothetical protein
MIDTDIIGICQIMQETLFNETVGQGERHISWVDISFDYSSIIFCDIFLNPKSAINSCLQIDEYNETHLHYFLYKKYIFHRIFIVEGKKNLELLCRRHL